jgi:hypothetical protein
MPYFSVLLEEFVIKLELQAYCEAWRELTVRIRALVLADDGINHCSLVGSDDCCCQCHGLGTCTING